MGLMTGVYLRSGGGGRVSAAPQQARIDNSQPVKQSLRSVAPKIAVADKRQSYPGA